DAAQALPIEETARPRLLLKHDERVAVGLGRAFDAANVGVELGALGRRRHPLAQPIVVLAIDEDAPGVAAGVLARAAETPKSRHVPRRDELHGATIQGRCRRRDSNPPSPSSGRFLGCCLYRSTPPAGGATLARGVGRPSTGQGLHAIGCPWARWRPSSSTSTERWSTASARAPRRWRASWPARG